MRIFIILCLLLGSLITDASEYLMSPLEQIKAAPALKLPDTTDQMINLADYKGKYVLINFWAYWCGPCIREFPALQSLYQALNSQGLELLAIHVGSFEAGGLHFLTNASVSFKVLLDQETKLKGWQVPVLPMSYLVDPKGNLVYQATGSREWGVVAMKKLMQKN